MQDIAACNAVAAPEGEKNMKTFSYTIKDAQGIHARPAGELVKAAKGFSSEIKIKKEIGRAHV